ncbi:MAG: beta-ketoacyl-[acyl-carrier-protein] synthase family protein [Desulfovibrio sp.]|jgi:3-oxoacyl-[acyl-carrier-protein] synthase II|nr:beta-ketoacyl-[acyl-carrier-protein] synthase family protein [Desulfovibrio sp.]
MPLKRVVITGMGAVSPYGKGSDLLFSLLLAGENAVQRLESLENISGLGPRVAAVVPDIGIKEIPRQMRRSMSSMSAYAYIAALEALDQAGLDVPATEKGRLGIALGSTMGSPENLESFFRQYISSTSVDQVKSMLFFRIMSNSAAANLAQALGVTGRVLSPAAACSSGCQAIGLGYEAIAFGRQDYMLCGGTDEYHPLVSGTFDIMAAASTAYNDAPALTPRPFDMRRDGVVCAEGAGIVFMESLDSALHRNADILAEIAGFASTCDIGSIASPSSDSIAACIKAALEDAKIASKDVGYVNAHATGTELGDIAESQAIASIFGGTVPVSSLKGHIGHTMAASGALESIAAIHMLNKKIIIPTHNLEEPDPRCSEIFLPLERIAFTKGLVVKNSFALGGTNCALVLKRFNSENAIRGMA